MTVWSTPGWGPKRGAKREPPQPAPIAAETVVFSTDDAGRVWSDLDSNERHRLFHASPELFMSLRAEAGERVAESPERRVLVAQARAEGKLTPELELYWAGRPVDAMRRWLADAPVVATATARVLQSRASSYPQIQNAKPQ